MHKLRCPQCGLSHIKRNGLTYYGKQNYRCKDCDRQFVEGVLSVTSLERWKLVSMRGGLTIASIGLQSASGPSVKACGWPR
jgi:transposase-like protein